MEDQRDLERFIAYLHKRGYQPNLASVDATGFVADISGKVNRSHFTYARPKAFGVWFVRLSVLDLHNEQITDGLF
jgi:hypothetical protein